MIKGRVVRAPGTTNTLTAYCNGCGEQCFPCTASVRRGFATDQTVPIPHKHRCGTTHGVTISTHRKMKMVSQTPDQEVIVISRIRVLQRGV